MSIESEIGKVSLAALRGASKATRKWAAREGIDPVSATRAMNDTVRDGVNNLYHSASIDSALRTATSWLGKEGNTLARTANPGRLSANAKGFLDEFGANVEFLETNRKAGGPRLPDPVYMLDKVPRGTVVASVAKKRARRSARGAM